MTARRYVPIPNGPSEENYVFDNVFVRMPNSQENFLTYSATARHHSRYTLRRKGFNELGKSGVISGLVRPHVRKLVLRLLKKVRSNFIIMNE
jgi:hypothetical protein